MHENRKFKTCSIPLGIEQTVDENHKSKVMYLIFFVSFELFNFYVFIQEMFESIRVNEIAVITSSAWNQSLKDVQIPFKINNTFLANQLIFD